MKVFVTGGTGAIGNHAVPAIVRAGHIVDDEPLTKRAYADALAAAAGSRRGLGLRAGWRYCSVTVQRRSHDRCVSAMRVSGKHPGGCPCTQAHAKAGRPRQRPSISGPDNRALCKPPVSRRHLPVVAETAGLSNSR